jgi:hypothetical protein
MGEIYRATDSKLGRSVAINFCRKRSQIRGIDVSTTGEFTFRNPRSLQVPEALMYQNYRDYDVTRVADKFVILEPE